MLHIVSADLHSRLPSGNCGSFLELQLADSLSRLPLSDPLSLYAATLSPSSHTTADRSTLPHHVLLLITRRSLNSSTTSIHSPPHTHQHTTLTTLSDEMAAATMNAQPPQSVFPKSHVGFDSITTQIEKKLLKRGFQFNVICVGMSDQQYCANGDVPFSASTEAAIGI